MYLFMGCLQMYPVYGLLADVPCPSRWMSDESNDMTTCYYVSSNETDGVASWQEAVNKCRLLAGLPDAHLVAITSQSELVPSFLVTVISPHPPTLNWCLPFL